MKITVFIGGLTGGGAERVACNLINDLSVKGHDVTVLSVSGVENTYGIDGRVKLISLEGKRRIKLAPIRVLSKMIKLKKFLKKNVTDLYVVFLPKTIMALFHYKKYVHAPIVVTESISPTAYSKRKLNKLTRCFKAADGAVFLTDAAMKFYTDRIDLKSGIVIPNAVNPEFLLPPFTGERKKTIVAVGRHTEQKNFPLLISAFSEIAGKFPEYTLFIYGGGHLTESYKKQCEKLGIADRVVFPGFCDNMQNEIRNASLFVLSSDYEGVPVALIEALALGLPCVSTDCEGGGARFLIEDGVSGIIVPIKNERKLAQAMEKVLSDGALSSALSKNALSIREKLAPAKIYAEWEKYFYKVIKDEV